jgi:hypothetical protein
VLELAGGNEIRIGEVGERLVLRFNFLQAQHAQLELKLCRGVSKFEVLRKE